MVDGTATLNAVQCLPLLGPWPNGEETAAVVETAIRKLNSTGTNTSLAGNGHADALRNSEAATGSAGGKGFVGGKVPPEQKLPPEQAGVAGPENELAAEALLTLCKTLGVTYNPLVLCSAPGLGKTHLANGLVTYWSRKADDNQQRQSSAFHAVSASTRERVPLSTHSQPEPTAYLYFRGAEFALAYTRAVERSQLRAFQDRIRQARLLVIDDLSQLAGKRGPLGELQYTIDELLGNGGQIVVTSRLNLELISGMTPPLFARLSCGLLASLQPPGQLTREQLWERYTSIRGIFAERNVLASLAQQLNLTAGEIWQLAGELAALSPTNDAIRGEDARALLTRQRTLQKPSIKAITHLCAKYFNLKVADLQSPNRRRAVVNARNMAMFLARQFGDFSLEQLGKQFGGRDHTTVMHGLRTVEQRLRTDSQLRQAFDDLRSLLAQR
jgi:chromosomal replication initiator protein